jgi:hypothetical protein
VDELTTALGGAVLSRVRAPEPDAVVRGVVLHTPGDPAPEPDLLLLCTTPEEALPPAVAVAVRESAVAGVLARVPPQAAVFTVPDTARWSDLYDRVQLALRDSFGQLAAQDAFQLADALAGALGGAVAIEDAGRRVVAFSTVPDQPIDDVRRRGILGRHVPEHVERKQWYARLWRAPGVCEFAAGEETTSRLAIAVRAGAEPLGSIWVIGTRDTLHPGADEILGKAVGMVAACLTHQDHFASRGRRTRGQVLRQLLGGAGAGGGPGQALGYRLPGRTVLVAVSCPEQAGDRELLDARLADVLSLHAHRFQGSGLAATVDDRVYALLPADERPRLAAQLSRVTAAPGWVAVSPVVDRVEQLPRARRQVDQLLGLCRWRGAPDGSVAYVDDEREELLFADVADAVRQVVALREGTVQAIARHDREHGTAYVPTLRAWFDACGDVKLAAARLHVHANTFRYRLTRAGALFGLNLDEPDQRLLVHLQLRLADFW